MAKGAKQAIANLNSQIGRIRGVTMAGLLGGGLMIQGNSQRRVPVEYGNLRGSAYTRKSQKKPMAVEVGYTAAYAIYVHENLEMKWKGKPRKSGKGVYWGPAGESQFLLKAARDESPNVLAYIKKKAEV